MKTYRFLILMSILLLLSAPAWAQTALNSTTLGEAVDNSETAIDIAATTNVDAGDIAVVDAEAMLVVSVDTTNNVMQVQRGWAGTAAVAHANGDTVYIDEPDRFGSQERSGTCTRGGEYPNYEPLVVLPSGNRYACYNSKWTKTHTAGRSNAVQAALSYGPTVADHVDSIFWIADRDYHVAAIHAVWGTAESTGSMDVQVDRLQGTEAVGSGDNLLSAVIDATGTADTVTAGTLVTTSATLDILEDNRLGVDLTATPNEITELTVMVTLYPIE